MNIDTFVNSKIPNALRPGFGDLSNDLGFTFRLNVARDDFGGDAITFFMLKPEMMDEFIDNLTIRWAEFKQRKYGVVPTEPRLVRHHVSGEPDTWRVPAGVGHF